MAQNSHQERLKFVIGTQMENFGVRRIHVPTLEEASALTQSVDPRTGKVETNTRGNGGTKRLLAGGYDRR